MVEPDRFSIVCSELQTGKARRFERDTAGLPAAGGKEDWVPALYQDHDALFPAPRPWLFLKTGPLGRFFLFS